jgi:hypothetical protein
MYFQLEDMRREAAAEKMRMEAEILRLSDELYRTKALLPSALKPFADNFVNRQPLSRHGAGGQGSRSHAAGRKNRSWLSVPLSIFSFFFADGSNEGHAIEGGGEEDVPTVLLNV